ncbi:copper amine oxidase N-terminal domain-containing protein [Paenibacillus apiarius]|uniref:copper amine oxidase N-terminal domain-containing protein n=1 Tax=Paenibacillus apiarius TaxID=46240 RepID=UPI00197F501A|nr:copper amine oxidase N-terminal domain-containing protein [Paenibacillus apiarius]MBN3522458.1 copper amine oxidase N-terminal domain-containing protein [Paenibacillus apiarius]
MHFSFRKYSIHVLLGCLLLSLSMPLAAAAADTAEQPNQSVEAAQPLVQILNKDGEPIAADSLILHDMTYLPIKDISPNLDLKVRWEASSRTVYIEGDVADITWNSLTNKMKVNSKDTILTTMPEIVNSKTYIPLQLLREVFQVDYDWDEKTKTVTLLYEPDNANL